VIEDPASAAAGMLATWLGSVLGGTRGGAASDVWQAGVPDVIDLGTVAPGESATATLWLHNTGATPLTGVAILATLVGGPHRHPPRLMTIPTVVPELPPGRPCAVEIHVTTERATAEGDFVWELTSEGAPNVVRVFLVVADSPAFEPAPTQFVSRLRVYASMVRRAMLEQIPTGEPANYLYQLVREYPYRPGKHMRAAICLSICEALGGSATGALDIASSLELLHNALLIHDDIEDGSGLRRGEITLHERHGVPLALNAGDALAMFAVESLHAVVQRVDGWLATRLRAEFNHATRRTVEGQAIELGWQREGVVDLSVDDYVAMATLKTCAYTTVLPMRVGALLANTPPIDLDGFTTLAIPLGLAFQIRDDLLSLEASSGAGKDALGDLYEGKRSLPIIHLLSTSTGPDHDFLRRFLKDERTERSPSAVHEVRALLEQYGSVAFATSRARQFAIEARNRFDETFAPTPSSPALDFLREMIDFMVDRRF